MDSWHRTISLALVSTLALAGCAGQNAAGRPQALRTATAAAAPRCASSAALERVVHELVNRHRSARGLAPLALHPRISREARQHSVAMAAGTTPLGHQGFENRVLALRHVMPCQRSAENVAFNRGHRDPASEAVRGWLASRTHRENIEGPYEVTGVGVWCNAAGEVYFTQMFVGR